MDNVKENQIEDSTFEYKSGGVNPWGVDFVEQSGSSGYIQRNAPINEPDVENTVEDTEVSNEIIVDSDNSSDSNYQSSAALVDSDDEEIDNFAYFTAKKLKDEGILPVEDIEKDVTFDDIYNAYRYTTEERIKMEVLNEVQNSLSTAGIKEENLILLQAIENGVDPDELNIVNRFQKYSRVDSAELEEDKKLNIIKEMYQLRNLSEKEINRNLDAIQVNDEVDDEFIQAQEFFKGAVNEFEQEQKYIAQQRLLEQQAIQEHNNQILDRAIRLGQLGDDKLTSEQSKELERAILDRNLVVDMGGQQYRMTPFEEFLFRMNNDFEFQLLNFKNHMYRGREVEILKQKAIEETDKDYWAAFKKAQSKSAQKGSIKRKESKDSSSYINETGGRVFEFGV